MRRVWIFVGVTFLLTWTYEFLVVYPLADGDVSQGISPVTTMAIAAAMFFPAIGVLVTRLVTHEGFKNCVLKPYPWRKSLPWFLVAWFGPAVLVLLGTLLYFAIFPGDFDPEGSSFAALLASQLEAAGMPNQLPMSVPMMALVQILVGIFIGPLANFIPSFGEEWGWRGYLMPKMAHHMHIVPALLASGVIWGLWHAPLTALGHNYGLGYPGWPITGILAMCAFCIVNGVFLSYVTIRTGSCLAGAMGHGGLNALAGASTIFASAGISPFIGPSPTGVIGGAAFIAMAIWMLYDLRKREQAGMLVVPQAGESAEICQIPY